jgi:hypothetical protein
MGQVLRLCRSGLATQGFQRSGDAGARPYAPQVLYGCNYAPRHPPHVRFPQPIRYFLLVPGNVLTNLHHAAVGKHRDRYNAHDGFTPPQHWAAGGQVWGSARLSGEGFCGGMLQSLWTPGQASARQHRLRYILTLSQGYRLLDQLFPSAY